ncbi:putative glycoside hydrolase [Candidatus Giovannonibacteria bacterium]|nr:putative glycoside hydrolase [Candidatus Giovannonibacteria bacterium]
MRRKYVYFLGIVCMFGIFAFFFKTYAPAEYISAKSEEFVEDLPLPPSRHLKTPIPVKGIYMTSWVAGTKNWRDKLINFVDKTEINTIVIDVKDYSGRISFEVSDPILVELEYTEKRISDIENLIEILHKKNIYVIGRISVFQDPHLAKKRPDLALKNKSGEVWSDRRGLMWVDPASSEVWDITVAISKEAERAGFDELNFDYIRFPSDGNIKDARYPFWDGKMKKSEVINNFFSYLNENLKDIGVPISADIFGMTTVTSNDLNIGQVFEDAVKNFDYVSPMVYPSHFAKGFMGYKNPSEFPYEVIKKALDDARAKTLAIGQDPEKIRPWIQDFNLGTKYDSPMIKKEIKAVYDSGFSSWLSWDPSNQYTPEAYLKD